MNTNTMVTLLRIIKNNGGISSLQSAGYTYTQINALLYEAITKRYVSSENNGLSITDAGEKFIKEYLEMESSNILNRWVEKRPEYFSKPLGLYDIFLPKNCDLDGLH